MSYTALCKQWEKEHKQKEKLHKIEIEQRRKEEERINSYVICEELLNRITEQEKKRQLTKIKDNIRLELTKYNPFTYVQFLIIWDIFGNNYEQILIDKYKNRISNNDIILVIDYIEKYSKEIITDYWKNKILEG